MTTCRAHMRGMRRGLRLHGRFYHASSGPVRIGFLGGGDISSLHAEGLRKTQGADLVGLWNRESCPIVPNPAQKADEYGCRLFDSAASLVTSPDIDAVYVLTNMETHLQYATMAMEAGKHVLVEKPVGASLDELYQMKQIAEANRVAIVPGHNYIHEPQIDRIKDLVDSGALGTITQLYIMYNIKHTEDICVTLPGIIRQILTHHGYIALYTVGEALGAPVTVSAMSAFPYQSVEKMKAAGANDGKELSNDFLSHVTMQFGSGALAHLQASFVNDDHSSAPWSFVVKVSGTEGSCHYNYNDFIVNEPLLAHSHTYCSYPYTVQAQSDYFANTVLRAGGPPKSTMGDAITCQKIIEASERSIEQRRHVDLAEF